LRAFRGKLKGDGKTDSFGGTGNQSRFVI